MNHDLFDHAFTPPTRDQLLEDLNAPQREAVTHHGGPLLVLAGAGSGKTRALTRKLAYLILYEGYAPWELMAVTFTNKAAAEMRERTEELLGERAQGIWLGTFHSIGVRLLRQYGGHLGLDPHFVIHDAGDQETMVKRLLKAQNISEKSLHPRVVTHFINENKQRCIGPDDPTLGGDFIDRRLRDLYIAYQKAMREAGAVDFADLIWLPHVLLSTVPSVAHELHLRFRMILVDEFQDTNRAQHMLIHALLGPQTKICAVGDDDQSIYRWRGAEVENILRFDKDFEEARVIRFEQNYRSTPEILAVSGALIAKNKGRHGKTLFTTKPGGSKVRLFGSYTEREEAEYVVQRIDNLRTTYPLDGFAIIYRTNAQSRSFEEQLRARGLPYRIYGGLRFYDRAEIKDIIAYLRLLVNPSDPISLLRVINRPSRKIGAVTIDRLEAQAEAEGSTLWEATCELARSASGSTASRLSAFVELIIGLRDFAETESAIDVARELLHRTEYLAWLVRDGSVEAETRARNIDELLSAISEFSERKAENSLAAWLDEVALASNMDEAEEGPAVTLLTAHMAKGLEFDVVFVTGLEDDLMPHSMSKDEPGGLEEERRLAYVAMTRARDHLFLTHASTRRRFGRIMPASPSPFIRDLPEEQLRIEGQRASAPSARAPLGWSRPEYRSARPEPRAQATRDFAPDPTPDWASQSQAPPEPGDGEWAPKMRAFHPKFGEGLVTRVEGQGDNAKVSVRFWDGQTRKLLGRFLTEI